jgi:anionic cell wall polymer biosynthesis LytR-Cps2A-Psr (LCP) family protein
VQRLMDQVGQLAPEDRDLLVLIAWEGFSNRDAAAVLGIPAGTVGSRLHRIRAAWQQDRSSDLGRMARQQDFLKRSIDQTLARIAADPTSLSRLIDAATASLKVDSQTDLRKLAATVRSAVAGSIQSSTLPIASVNDADRLVMDAEKAAPVLAELQGKTVSDPKPLTEPVTTDVLTVLDKPLVPVSDC